jgi:hypothetical protein
MTSTSKHANTMYRKPLKIESSTEKVAKNSRLWVERRLVFDNVDCFVEDGILIRFA